MAKKGEKMSAETRAKMSQAHRDRWVKIRQQMNECAVDEIASNRIAARSSIDAVLNARPGTISVIRKNVDGSVVFGIDAADDQHLIDTCNPRCNNVSLWSRIKAFLRGAL